MSLIATTHIREDWRWGVRKSVESRNIGWRDSIGNWRRLCTIPIPSRTKRRCGHENTMIRPHTLRAR